MGKHLGVEYKVRMPQELKDKISESAKELNRSMNADIVDRLEKSFKKVIALEQELVEIKNLLKQSMDENNQHFHAITELSKNNMLK